MDTFEQKICIFQIATHPVITALQSINIELVHHGKIPEEGAFGSFIVNVLYDIASASKNLGFIMCNKDARNLR